MKNEIISNDFLHQEKKSDKEPSFKVIYDFIQIWELYISSDVTTFAQISKKLGLSQARIYYVLKYFPREKKKIKRRFNLHKLKK